VKQSSTDVLRQARIVEEERAWQHLPGGPRSIEGAIAPHVGVLGQGSSGNESMCRANSRDQVERGDARTPPLCRQEGGQEGNDDYDDNAVGSLAPLDVRDAAPYALPHEQIVVDEIQSSTSLNLEPELSSMGKTRFEGRQP
jgi:hypothetical protein